MSIDDALLGQDSISQVRVSDRGVSWLAGIASEDGRVTIRCSTSEGIVDLTPDANVRTRVMEYGGGAYDANGPLVVYHDDTTSSVVVLEDGSRRVIAESAGRFRFGGLHLVPERRWVVAVREDHSVEPEERSEIVALSLDTDNRDGGLVLAGGADFYAGPTVHGDTLAWFQWHHPDMSWDSAEVMTRDLRTDSPGQLVAGGNGVSAMHPMWCCHGQLAWVSDESGFWNWSITRTDGSTDTWRVEHDCAGPTWVLNRPAACCVAEDLVATVEYADGAGALALWQPSTGGVTYPLPHTAGIESIAARDFDLFVVATWRDRPASLLRISPTGVVEEIVTSTPMEGAVSPVSRWSQGPAGPVQSWFYSPRNVDTPPLVVMTHGGPTSWHDAALDRDIQFWVSRGFAVLDVNYSGSTGFGRAYRDRLRSQWGILDVADVEAAVRDVVGAGLADGSRVAITGGSAGGYTTLQALVSSDVFAAGISSYGIGDLTTLVTDTHKAESRYPHSLVGPWPQDRETYLVRSPIRHLDRLATPMLILQGLEDKVVPPNQAFAMADAVREAGKPLAVVTFEGEGHGFRQLANRRRALQAKVSFLEQVFGLEHSSDVPRLDVENL